ncbi:transposase family protein, partial [Salmonella enterica subsp. enterica serovar London]|nr:transposase family protein [Salmonella enterica subsp. enterica serovar London]
KDRIVLRFGTPEVFLSDNGTEFKNKAVDDYLGKIGVVHSTTPPYHPQANPAERVNRTLKTRIVAYIEGKHNTWDELLPELVFSLNNTTHASIGTTPAMLNFGRKPVPPDTSKHIKDQVAANAKEDAAVDALKLRLERLEELQVTGARISQSEHERQAEYFNASRREAEFKKG